MDPCCLTAFEDELTKIAGFREHLRQIMDFFRPPSERVKRRVDYLFSEKTGPEKWDYLTQYANEQQFVDAVVQNPRADEKLKAHVQGLHDLSRGKPVGKIPSTTAPGKTYEVRKLADGSLGCMCGDWRYRGTVVPGYKCKHIQQYEAGKSRA